MKRIYKEDGASEAKGNSFKIKSNEQRKQAMTNEEAEKWIKIFSDCLEDWVTKNESERGAAI